MVENIRKVEKAIGTVCYPDNPDNISGRSYARSLYVAEDVKAGDMITEDNVRSVRPGYGLHPKYLPKVLGKLFKNDYNKGERFLLDMIKQ